MSLPGKKKEVRRLNLTDHRYTPLNVESESERIIYCKKHENTLPRFFKLGPGFTGPKDTMFLTVEGNPLVAYVKEGKPVKEPLVAFLKLIWGEDVYMKLKDTTRKTLEDGGVGVTVEVVPYIPEDNDLAVKKAFDEIKAEGILYDADLDNLAKFGESREAKDKIQRFFEVLPWLLAGMGLTFLLNSMNIIKV